LEGLCLALSDWSAELRRLRGWATRRARLAHVRSGGAGLTCGPWPYLERRLRQLEAGLLPALATPESRRILDAVLDKEGRRAARLGLPELDDDPEPKYRPGMSIGDTIRAGVQRLRERWAAEEAGARQ